MRRSLSVAVRLTLLLCLLGLPAATTSASSLGLNDPVLLYGPESLQLTVQGVVVHEVETFSTRPPVPLMRIPAKRSGLVGSCLWPT